MKIVYEIEGESDELAAFSAFLISVIQEAFSRQPVAQAEPVEAVAEEWLDDLYAAEDEAEAESEVEVEAEEEEAEKQERKAPLPSLSPDVRKATKAAFSQVVEAWLEGFENPEVSQPDRLELLRALGSGPHSMPVVVMAYEMESLQALVFHAMLDAGLALTWGKEEDMDLAHRVAGNMVQISHLAYPDLAGTFDHSTQWRKK